MKVVPDDSKLNTDASCARFRFYLRSMSPVCGALCTAVPFPNGSVALLFSKIAFANCNFEKELPGAPFPSKLIKQLQQAPKNLIECNMV